MLTRRLGSSDLEVSRLGLGTMAWGQDTPISEVMALWRRFRDAGGNLIDTAAAYGDGAVERLIGQLAGSAQRRGEVVIATKSGYVLRQGQRVVETGRQALLDELAGSLRRLRVDQVDLWQIHAWGQAPLEETLAAADQAVAAGMAGQVGVCNYVGWQLAQAATWQRAVRGRTPIASAQVEYSLLARRAEIEVLPCCQSLGLGFLPWSALGRGVLTGQYRNSTPPGSRAASKHLAWFVEPYLTETARGVVEAVVRAGQGLGLSPVQVAWLWVRDAPGVSAALVGPRTAAQLEPLLEVEDQVLPDPIARALDDVSGGPNQLRAAPPE
ncbi:MAG: aldo/keto reductase [Propionibacteriaceae bacterium]|jgi:aryl-alcohol dehydrogenase-like predicted oxidoreductase|nr:aldo/keto reductase [Propionibacteriaceae bacterium]